MGLFDKINDITKKATGMVGTYSSKVQNVSNNSDKSNTPVLIDIKNTVPTGTDDGSTVEKITGEAHTFQLNGIEFIFEENKDIFNSYRKIFSELAKKCADNAVNEYNSTITDYISFMEKLPDIFDRNLYPLIKKAMDYLIAENVWSVSFETFSKEFKSKLSSVCIDYETMVKSTNLTFEANNEMADKLVSQISDSQRNKSNGQIFSLLSEAINEKAMDRSRRNNVITSKQQTELYGRIKKEAMFREIHDDYLRVCDLFIAVLNQHGHTIWTPNYKNKQEIKTLFDNIRNPNFPEAKTAAAMVEIMNENPYNEEFYPFILSKFGDTTEIRNLIDYFGYSHIIA